MTDDDTPELPEPPEIPEPYEPAEQPPTAGEPPRPVDDRQRGAVRKDWLHTVARATETVAPLVARQAPKPDEIPDDRRGRWATLLAIIGILMAVFQFLLNFFDLVTRPLAPLAGVLPYVAGLLFLVGAGFAFYAALRAHTRRQRLWSLAVAGVIVVAAIGWGGWLAYDAWRPPAGYRILISEFDGASASQQIDFARRIAESLRTQLAEAGTPIEIKRVPEIYSDVEDARAHGAQQKAGMVIWGWYDDQGVSPHVELLQLPGIAVESMQKPVLFATAKAASGSAPPLAAVMGKLATVTRTPPAPPDLNMFAAYGPDQMAFVTSSILGMGMLASGERAKAMTLLDQALAAVEGDPAAAQGQDVIYYQRALLEFQDGRMDEAKRDLEAALRLSPDSFEAHTLLALVFAQGCAPNLDYQAALDEAKQAARLRPDDADAQRFVAEAAVQAGDLPVALTAAETALRLDPAWPEVHTVLANVYAAQGKSADALAARQTAVRLWEQRVADPAQAFPDAYYALGDAYMAIDAYLQAQAAYTQAGRLAPSDARYERALGNVLYWQGKTQEALDVYTKWQSIAPADATAPLLLGLVHDERGETDEALAAYTQAAQLATCDPAPHLLLGNTYFVRADYADARASYRRALEIDPDNVDATYAAGAASFAAGDFADAAQQFAAYVALVPDSPQANYWPGATYATLGEKAKAQAAFEKVLALSKDPEPTLWVAYAYDELDRLDEAVAAYLKLLAQNESADLHAYLASVYARKGAVDLARSEYERALELQPDHRLALEWLGNLLYDQGEMETAAARYAQLLALEESAPVELKLGQAYLNLGELDKALAHFQAADRLNPQDLMTNYQLGLAASWAGRLDAAEAAFGTAERLQPDNPGVSMALAQVAYKRCDLPGAVAKLERAATLAPDVVLYAGMLAGDYLAQGNVDAARTQVARLQARPASDYTAHWLAGAALMALGERQQAAQELETAVTVTGAPSAVLGPAYTTLGRLAAQRDAGPAATAAYTTALAVAPGYVDAMVGLGDLALAGNDPVGAVQQYKAALAGLDAYAWQYSYDGATILEPALHVRLALAEQKRGDAGAAAQALATAEAKQSGLAQATPDWAPIALVDGMIRTVRGDAAGAERAFAQALKCDATLAQAREQFETLAR